MKALSLSQPWCWAVLHANKHIENRSWQPPIEMIGQQIVLHAAKSWDKDQVYHLRTCPLNVPVCSRDGHTACPTRNALRERMCTLGEPGTGLPLTPVGYLLALGIDGFPGRHDLYDTSALVGIATIDRIVTTPDTLPDDQKRWFFGPFGWVLTNVLRLPRPIACAGKQGLWTVPAPLTAEIAEMAAA